MFKRFKTCYIWIIIGITIFICLSCCYIKRKDNKTHTQNIIETNDELRDITEENNHIVEENDKTKEITSNKEENNNSSSFIENDLSNEVFTNYDECNEYEEEVTTNNSFNNQNKEEASTQIIEKNEIINESSIQKEIIDDSVDSNAFNYNIHNGKIDCVDIDSCMDISLPIQFEFSSSIANTFYLEVMSKSNNVLGYYIEYVFTNNNYSNSEECNSIGQSIKNRLSDRVSSYQCNDSTLIINTIY